MKNHFARDNCTFHILLYPNVQFIKEKDMCMVLNERNFKCELE